MGENGTTGDDIFLTNFSLNSPGSMHTAQTLSFVGKCANEDSANLGTATLTIPAGHQGPLSQTKRIPENSDSSGPAPPARARRGSSPRSAAWHR